MNVFVGLSGGVDSAVSAALLQKEGHAVTGVFIKGWYPPGLSCTWAEDRRDAMRVAAKLRMPFRTLDASSEYKKGVIDYLLSEYEAGRTPNPDVMCNRDVKFGAFYEFARKEGADMIATGHYAKAQDGKLYRGVDPAKDQSYFLWAIAKEALAHTLFPLGGFKKEKTRELARKFALPVATKRDSQGVCFLGSISVEDFLRSEFGEAPGSAVDESGKEVGGHNGAVLHTIGERVSLTDAPPGPWYVVRKSVKENLLVVAKERRTEVLTKSISFSGANWLTDDVPEGKLEAQYRYHGPVIEGTLDTSGTAFLPTRPLPDALANGQSLVFYQGEECLGGAIIG
ncbi:MAG: tRNA 2-thiouridine(34) synthase MnmA [Candidatus Pacebacteria bacterium]|nr:tRNA 2-thiouridine(34) synthase MnmA [Candidatus Paceibacterota bacterium]